MASLGSFGRLAIFDVAMLSDTISAFPEGCKDCRGREALNPISDSA